MEKVSSSSALTGPTLFFGRNGDNLASNAFPKVCIFYIINPSHILYLDDEDVRAPEKRSRTIKTKIPISVNISGRPDLPSISMYEYHEAKMVQSMLREYCRAHISEALFFYLFNKV
jgi:hypothetical protein